MILNLIIEEITFNVIDHQVYVNNVSATVKMCTNTISIKRTEHDNKKSGCYSEKIDRPSNKFIDPQKNC